MASSDRSRRLARLAAVGLALVLLVALSSGRPSAAEPGWEVISVEAMATRIELTLPRGRGEAAAAAIAAFRKVEQDANEWRAGSPLAAVNAAAGKDAVAVPSDLLRLVQRGRELGRATGGAFDITWAALWGLWDDFRTPRPPPAPEALAQRTRLIDYRRVEVDPAAGTVRLPEAGMAIGLGGIAKGYALALAAEALRAEGVADFALSAGGQVLVGGQRDGRPWRVGIRDPRGSPSDSFALVELRDASMSTSGDYERYFVHGGVRYHHILDPRTGLPARGLRSATVVSPDPTLADALSTAVMVLGRERGLEAASRLGADAVVVDDRGEVWATRGLSLTMVHAPSP